MVTRYLMRSDIPTTGAGRRKINPSATDKILAGITNAQGEALLRYDVLPDVLAPKAGFSLSGKERGQGKILSATRTSVSINAASPNFSPARPTINMDMSGGASDLVLGAAPAQYATFFMVATIGSVLFTTPRNAWLMSVRAGDGSFLFGLAMLTNRSMYFGAGATKGAVIPAGSQPAANARFLLAGSYNFGTNLFSAYLNGTTLTGSGSPDAPINVTAAENIVIGTQTAASSAGWDGELARMCVYDAVLTPNQMATVVAALKDEYSIA